MLRKNIKPQITYIYIYIYVMFFCIFFYPTHATRHQICGKSLCPHPTYVTRRWAPAGWKACGAGGTGGLMLLGWSGVGDGGFWGTCTQHSYHRADRAPLTKALLSPPRSQHWRKLRKPLRGFASLGQSPCRTMFCWRGVDAWQICEVLIIVKTD